MYWLVNICHNFTIFRGQIVCKYISALIVVRFSYTMLKCFDGHHSQSRSVRVRPRTFRNTERYCFREGVKNTPGVQYFPFMFGALCICKGRGWAWRGGGRGGVGCSEANSGNQEGSFLRPHISI